MAQFQHESKQKLLDATLKVVRAKGYTATRIEDVCAEAGLTKGSFFHHFKGKQDLALSAIAHWDDFTTRFFADAPYHDKTDPLHRLLAYIEFRRDLMTGALPEFTCLVGTIVQEIYETDAELREACERNICGHAKTLEADIRAAMQKYKIGGGWTAEGLSLSIQSMIQGAFIMAKTTGSVAVAALSMDHLHRYLELLFGRRPKRPSSRRRRAM